MAKITSDYDSHTKDELLAEAHSRNIDTVSSASLKADIVAALELSDDEKENAEVEQPKAPLPPLVASPIPQIAKTPDNIPAAEGASLKDEDFTDGIFTMKEGNHVGEDFALAIHAPNTYGRTHTLRNSIHQWEGTEKEFRAAFEKK